MNKNDIKSNVMRYGMLAIAYGQRWKVLELQGKDHLPDTQLEDIKADMNTLGLKIIDDIDKL